MKHKSYGATNAEIIYLKMVEQLCINAAVEVATLRDKDVDTHTLNTIDSYLEAAAKDIRHLRNWLAQPFDLTHPTSASLTYLKSRAVIGLNALVLQAPQPSWLDIILNGLISTAPANHDSQPIKACLREALPFGFKALYGAFYHKRTGLYDLEDLTHAEFSWVHLFVFNELIASDAVSDSDLISFCTPLLGDPASE